MNDPETRPGAQREQQLRDMNEALLVSSVRQHELTELADKGRDAAEAARDTAETARDTAEKLAAALRESEHRYRTLFESIDEGFCTIEVLFDDANQPIDYVFLDVNPVFERQTGIPNAVGRRMRQIAPDHEGHWFETYGRIALTGEPKRFQNQAAALGRWYDVYAFRIGSPEDRRVGVLFNDVTAHKRAEEALRQSEQRYRTIVDQVKDYAIFSTDVQGRATTWNQGVKQVLGFDEADFLGTDITKAIFTPEDIAKGVPQMEIEEATRTGTASDDRWMQRKDGTRFFALGVTTALRDETGRLLGFTKVMRDQTERKQAEEAAARLAAIVTSSEDAIISKDLEGILTSWNKGAERLFGYTVEEVVGKPVTLLLPPDHRDEELQILERIRRGEAVEHYETVRRRKDGSLRDISLTVSPLRDAAGNIIGASKIARDITERSRLEKQTQQQAAELADLHRRKDEFLAMLSHELRNPLAPIMNAVQLLRLQKNEDTIQHQARTIIERQVGQLARLVDDLLEVSRISTGRVHLHEERLDLRGVVERAVETVRPLISQRGHVLTTRLPPTPVWLHADAARLEQVVVNLLTNAAKYTEKGGHIWLGLEVRSQESGVRGQGSGDKGQEVGISTGASSLTPDSCLLTPEAVLRIRDTGIGIAPDLLPRIFDLFTQADRSLDRAQGGLGVGLALVQQLVQLHHGQVEARSVLGQGSEFVVRLPVVAPAVPASPAPATETAPASGKGCRVLVVDDNVDAAQCLAMLLKEADHEVRTTHDGPTALAAAVDYRPDVVLLDIGLPGLSGLEVARRIRQQLTLKDILLVAMTGYGQEADRLRSQEVGFDHHLVKPVDFKDVQQILAGVAEKAT